MPKLQVASDKSSLTERDWEQAALNTIAHQGVAALAVEALARDLGVTKGSFYWHFANRDALIKAAVMRWEDNDIKTFERSIAMLSDPSSKLRLLFRRTIKEIQSHLIFSALFRSTDHPVVAEVMQRVSERRVSFLTRSYEELGMDSSAAGHRARLTYLSYVGFLQYYQQFKALRMSQQEVSEYIEHVIQSLIPQQHEE